jgi:hypothetical protein
VENDHRFYIAGHLLYGVHIEMKRLCYLLLALSFGAVGCPDDDPDPQTDTGPQDTRPDTEPDVPEDLGTDGGDVTDVAPDTGPEGYQLTIENTSDETSFPTAFSSGSLALHSQGQPMYSAGSTNRQDGLTRLAESGESRGFTNALGTLQNVVRSQSFSTERGAIRPGQSVEVILEDLSQSGTPRLSFASMFVESNDYVVGTADAGYPLFNGGSVNTGNLTSSLVLTDVGSERDQFPYLGPTQAPRQSFAEQGGGEGVIEVFQDTTRAIPEAYALVDVSISESNGDFTFTIDNIGTSAGSIVTPLSPPAYAIHNGNTALFQQEQQPGDFHQGLERLAEDGLANQLVSTLSGLGGVKSAAAASSGISPEGSVEFTVTPDSSHKRLSLASMVVRSNDAFLAFPPSGLKLLNDQGNPRPTDELETIVERRLAVWDASTELNESPGNGFHQPYFTDEVDTGVPDSDVDGVQRYSDSSNDLASPRNLISVSVNELEDEGSYEITVTNTTAGQGSRYVLSPVAHLTHSANNPVFEESREASSAVAALAEEGNPQPIVDARSEAAATSDPLSPGDSVTFNVTATAARQQLTFMTMVIPSNDAFIAANPAGVSLLSAGDPINAAQIESNIRNTLRVWDAGTERNEAGGAGPGQPNPFIENSGQSASDGEDEGDGSIHRVDSPLMPPVEAMLNVTLEKR